MEAGTPQGSPVSPLLANIALYVLDEVWDQAGRRQGMLIRFADDFVVLCPTRQRAEQARDLAVATLAPLGLRLHPDKTRIVDIGRGAGGFDFLGFHHRMVESRKRRGRFWLNKWPSPRAMASIRGRVRDLRSRPGVAGWRSSVIATASTQIGNSMNTTIPAGPARARTPRIANQRVHAFDIDNCGWNGEVVAGDEVDDHVVAVSWRSEGARTNRADH
ncbi:MAG: reverse transcriptase domain-containing protein [Acidimicrobiales bacterium]